MQRETTGPGDTGHQGDGKGSKDRRKSKVMIFLFLSFPGLLCRNKCISLPGDPNHWCGFPALEHSLLVISWNPPFGSLFGGVFMPLKMASHWIPGNSSFMETGKNSPFLSDTQTFQFLFQAPCLTRIQGSECV